MRRMIFLGGIHGVGKTTLSRKISENTKLPMYSSSDLILAEKQVAFSKNKKINNIENNQEMLLNAIEKLKTQNECFLLDGHFTLINNENKITRIPKEVFLKLSPCFIIMVIAPINKIISRLYKRDKIKYNVDFIDCFQNEEKMYAKEISQILQVPYFEFYNEGNFSDSLLDMINKILEV